MAYFTKLATAATLALSAAFTNAQANETNTVCKHVDGVAQPQLMQLAKETGTLADRMATSHPDAMAIADSVSEKFVVAFNNAKDCVETGDTRMQRLISQDMELIEAMKQGSPDAHAVFQDYVTEKAKQLSDAMQGKTSRTPTMHP